MTTTLINRMRSKKGKKKCIYIAGPKSYEPVGTRVNAYIVYEGLDNRGILLLPATDDGMSDCFIIGQRHSNEGYKADGTWIDVDDAFVNIGARS
jgi:hypothetical protein